MPFMITLLLFLLVIWISWVRHSVWPKARAVFPDGAFGVKRVSPSRKWQNFFSTHSPWNTYFRTEQNCLLNNHHNGKRMQGWFPPPPFSTIFRQRTTIFESVWHQLLNTFFRCISFFIAVRRIWVGLLLIAGKIFILSWCPCLSPGEKLLIWFSEKCRIMAIGLSLWRCWNFDRHVEV